jgi:surface-anchored protein
MRVCGQAILYAAGCANWLLAVPAAHGWDDLREAGHYDLAVNYTLAGGWEVYAYDHADQGRLDPRTTILAIDDRGLAAVPAGGEFAFLGGPGDPVWVFPEVYDPELVYLGIGAPLLQRGLFSGGLSNRGQVTMQLAAVTGSGPASGGGLVMWQSAFPPRVQFSTVDGIGEEDQLDRITANFHAHYNWGFTAPGLYRVSFEFSGTLLPEHGGGETGTTATFQFAVGDISDPSPLRYAWPGDGGWQWSSWMGHVYRAAGPWVYCLACGWIHLPDGDPDDFWLHSARQGWAWSSQRLFPRVWLAAGGTWSVLEMP